MDDRIRRLERSAITNDPSAWPLLLAAWVRAGHVVRGRAELAATLGCPTAQEALGLEPALQVYPSRPQLWRWIDALKGWGDRTLVRIAVALSRTALEHAAEEMGPWRSNHAKRAIVAAEQWLVCPCVRHGLLAGNKAARLLDDLGFGLGAELALAAETVRDVAYGRQVNLGRVLVGFRHRWVSPVQVTLGVRAELLPWVTGNRDPVFVRARRPYELPDYAWPWPAPGG